MPIPKRKPLPTRFVAGDPDEGDPASRFSLCRLDFEPVGKPRESRSDKWKPRPCVVAWRLWADLFRAEFRRQVGDPPPAASVKRLDWEAHFAVPESWSAKKKLALIGQLHRQKPDRDNIDKTILDCLYGGALALDQEGDDAAIAAGSMRKLWMPTGGLAVEIWWDAV